MQCYRLEDGTFRSVADAGGDATLTHPDWDGLEVHLADLWG